MRVTFFCFAKRKSPKKRRPPVCDPCAALRGDLRRGGCGGRRGTRFAAAQRRSDNHGESVHEARALRRACHPTTAPTQAQPAGGWGSRKSKQPHGPLLRSAPSRGRKRHALRRLGRVQRWPVWMSDSRVPFTMRRGAQGVGLHGRRSARASCSDLPWLFERRAQRKASSTAHPVTEHPRLPRSAAKGVQTVGSPFLW